MIKSGKDAYINGVHATVNWSITHAAALERYAASSTFGGTASTPGNENWTGQATGIGFHPPLMPTGTNFAFKGIVDATVGSVVAMDGNILVSQTQITIPVASSGPVTWSATFGGQGALTQGAVSAADTPAAPPVPAKHCGIMIAPSVADIAEPTALTDIQSITLTFNRPEVTYVSGGLTSRLPGNLEVDLAFDILDRTLVNSLYALNATTIAFICSLAGTVDIFNPYWQLPIRWGEKSNFIVDAKTRQPIGYTVNGQWQAEVGSLINSEFTGWILDPAGDYFFGTAPVE